MRKVAVTLTERELRMIRVALDTRADKEQNLADTATDGGEWQTRQLERADTYEELATRFVGIIRAL